MDFAVPADHRIKIRESEKRENYLDLVRELKISMECEGGDDTICKLVHLEGSPKAK